MPDLWSVEGAWQSGGFGLCGCANTLRLSVARDDGGMMVNCN